VAPGPQELNVTQHTEGTDEAVFWMYLEFLLGDTSLVYRDSLPGFMYAGHERPFAFDTWDAVQGSYLGRYVIRLDSPVIRDTLSWHFEVFGTPVAEALSGEGRPGEIALEDPWPNPFRARAVVQYDLPQEAEVSLVVYDANGRRRAVLAEGLAPAGHHSLVIDAGNPAFKIGAGVYFIRLEAAEREESGRPTVITRRMLVLP
jgi:hypothetical protein